MKSNPKLYLVIIALAATSSCKKKLNDPQPPDVAVNSEFAKHPPSVKQFYVKMIDGEKDYVLAQMKIDTSVFHGPYLAIMHSGKKLVWRDDGTGVDDIAADGIYSVPFFEKPGSLSKKLALLDASKKMPYFFKGREKVAYSAARSASMEPGFSSGTLVPIDPSIFSLGECNPFEKQQVIDHCLLIKDLNVIEDREYTFNEESTSAYKGHPDGAWTFWHLMKRLIRASSSDAVTDAEVSRFIYNWLQTFNNPQTVNGFRVPGRQRPLTGATVNELIIDQWLTLSGVAASAPESEREAGLSSAYCPFRLLAIVNRIDKHQSVSYHEINKQVDAGELRFVFCHNPAVSPEGGTNFRFTQFLVIFEYGVQVQKDCIGLKKYAYEWNALNDLKLTDQAYRDKLAEITEAYTTPGINSDHVNGSPLNQLRTNEAYLDLPWQLREFILDNTGGLHLETTTTKNEPNGIFNGRGISDQTKALADYINTNEAAILSGNYQLPEDIAAGDFLGPNADATAPVVAATCTSMPSTEQVYWDAYPMWHTDPTVPDLSLYKINNGEARHSFSLNTCSGCHNAVTETEFAHIKPSRLGSEPPLSAFLTGDYAGVTVFGSSCHWNRDASADSVEDPAEVKYIAAGDTPPDTDIHPKRRSFNDLERRYYLFCHLLSDDCEDILSLFGDIIHVPPPVH